MALFRFEAKALHTQLVQLDELVALSGLLAVEQETLVSVLFLVKAHTARLHFGGFLRLGHRGEI